MKIEEAISGGLQMIINFGPHKGHLAERVFFDDPRYVISVIMSKDCTGPMGDLRKTFESYIKIFDEKPFVCKCQDCGKGAIFLSYPHGGQAKHGSYCMRCSEHYWSRYVFISKTFDSIWALTLTKGNGLNNFLKDLIRNHAKAKGVKGRFTIEAIREFLNITITEVVKTKLSTVECQAEKLDLSECFPFDFVDDYFTDSE